MTVTTMMISMTATSMISTLVNGRKSVTWSAVPHAPLLVSQMLAIQLVLWLGGSGPIGDDDLWYHHREIFRFF